MSKQFFSLHFQFTFSEKNYDQQRLIFSKMVTDIGLDFVGKKSKKTIFVFEREDDQIDGQIVLQEDNLEIVPIILALFMYMSRFLDTPMLLNQQESVHQLFITKKLLVFDERIAPLNEELIFHIESFNKYFDAKQDKSLEDAQENVIKCIAKYGKGSILHVIKEQYHRVFENSLSDATSKIKDKRKQGGSIPPEIMKILKLLLDK